MYSTGPLSAHQRNAISIAFRCWSDSDPLFGGVRTSTITEISGSLANVAFCADRFPLLLLQAQTDVNRASCRYNGKSLHLIIALS